MAKAAVQVNQSRMGNRLKTSIKIATAFVLLLFVSSCRHAPVTDNPALVTTQQNQWRPQVFMGHPDWLAINIDPEPLEKIRHQIEGYEKQTLKSRGEAHITILSPPEYEKIKSKLDMGELELIVHQLDVQKTHWTPLCVARSVHPKDPKLMTYYMIVESSGLQEIRREIHRQFVKKGGDAVDFDLLNYHPHITIGFTERDLFETDGVIKDTLNCRYDLITPDGRKLTSWSL